MIVVEPHAEGATLLVKAQAGSRANAVRGEYQGALKVAITQVAEKGKANEALIDVLAKALRVRASQVQLIRGLTSSQKRFLVRGVTTEQLLEKLARALIPEP
jgi:uncharacterized protein YggU (UPF0235/DUF167 family)